MKHWMFEEVHEIFRKTVRKFIEKEVTSHIERWERDGHIPRSFFERLGELGYLGIKYPEEYGGMGSDVLMEMVFIEELTRGGAGGAVASISAHTLATTPILRYGSEEQKQRYVIPAIKGTAIVGLGVSEPDSGNDVASLQTFAEKHGDYYILNGSKTVVTNGVHADFIVIAAKTNESPGHHASSLFILDMNWPGCSVRQNVNKLGRRSSDSGEIFFENVKIPSECLIGKEHEGFTYLREIFMWERLLLAVSSVALAETALQAAIQYSKERSQFGKPIRQFQVLRHKMVDMAVDIERARHITYRAIYNYNKGQDVTTEAAMAKAYAGEMVNRVCDQAVQIYGGNGYMMEYPVQRYWRDARVHSIVGGTTEMMKEFLIKKLEI